eukprot:TRINITY_DN7927_c0_g1_i1.p1 TRINITY_DN7927_c0_g1~~TRINITY_DN7927_c0_g1_i1.p1  ORF type:complete len:728 (+),score=198.11 TRINITY_DN7927_c0_g1_i1:101-2284(+)
MAAEATDDEEDDDEDEDESDDEDEEEDDESGDARAPAKAAPAAVPQKQRGEEESFDPHGMKEGLVVNVNQLNPAKNYKVSDVIMTDLKKKTQLPPGDSFLELISNLPKGQVFKKSELEAELKSMTSTGMFKEGAKMEVEALKDGTLKLEVKFEEAEWNKAYSVRVVNVGLIPGERERELEMQKMDPQKAFASQEAAYQQKLANSRKPLIPEKIVKELSEMVAKEPALTARLIQKIRDRVQKWYIDKGYLCANVVNFGNLHTTEVVVEVQEGDITEVDIMFLDGTGKRFEGNTNLEVVKRELPRELQPGMVFNMDAGRKALQKLTALDLFANMEVNPQLDETVDTGVVVQVKLKELDPKNAEVNMEWSIAPGDTGKPTLTSWQPGGTIAFEHKNLDGWNRSFSGSVSSGNLLNPQDDLDFRMEFKYPYLYGVKDPRNAAGNVSIFNGRKMAAAFVGGPTADEVPVIIVDRAGLKGTITENFTPQSRLTYGVVAEEVTTRDESSAIVSQAVKLLPSGHPSVDGVPTTHSDTGTDRMVFLQGNLTRDNTSFVNGAVVGSRDILRVDQGLGIGSKWMFFNRSQISSTRFFQLSDEDLKNPDIPPWVGVVHGRLGNCLGDLPAYEAFTIGGPYSVRGYTMGEIGASRRILELAGELRIPVPALKSYAYLFAEYGGDLGGSNAVRKNPTKFFGRMGHGGAVGAGAKLGHVRIECVRDGNTGQSSWFVRYGDRF